MGKINITPTKSNYTELKEEFSLAKEGYLLLEQKREVLIIHLAQLIISIREKRSQLDQELFHIFNQLSLVQLETGNLNFDIIMKNISQDYEVESIPFSVMGVVVPKLIFVEKTTKNKSKVPMGISGTSPHFDRFIKMTKNIKGLMAEVAYLESTAWKIANEIKKIQRRINALENFIMPDIIDTIKFIKDILEEKDRETLFQIKRIKENQRKEVTLKKENSDDM